MGHSAGTQSAEGRLSVFVAKDDTLIAQGYTNPEKTKLYLDIAPQDNFQQATREKLLELLQTKVDTSQIIIPVIDDIVKALKSGETKIAQRKILQSKSATKGAPGRIEWCVHAHNVEERHAPENITTGQTIAKIFEPGHGEPGVDVFGKEIPAIAGDQVPAQFDISASLVEAHDGDAGHKLAISNNNGYLTINEGQARVCSTLSIKGNVDNCYGDVDFSGYVVINGDVTADRSVKARSGVHIDGNFLGKTLSSSHGSIYVSQYVFGGHNAVITAAKNFTATLVQEVNTEIIGNIYIRREAQSSTLRTAGALIMPDAALVGGKSYVVRGVEAGIIGNQAGTITQIHLASEIEASMEFAKLQVEIELIDHERELLLLKLGPLGDDYAKLQLLEPREREKVRAFMDKLRSTNARRSAASARLQHLQGTSGRKRILRVNFLKALYEGTEIHCGHEVFKTRETLRGPATIEYLSGIRQFVLKEYQGLE